MYKNDIYDAGVKNLCVGKPRRFLWPIIVIMMLIIMQVSAAETVAIKGKHKIEGSSFLKPGTAQQQVIEITGKIVDEKGIPLPGAIVKLKKEKKTYPANKNGEFSIQCPDEDAIVCFSYVGYITRELSAKTIQANPLIKLKTKLNSLTEVNIQGKTIGTKIDLKNRSHQNLAQVLEGSVAGLVLKGGSQTTTGETMVYGYSASGPVTMQQFYEQGVKDNSIHKNTYPTLADLQRAVNNGVNLGFGARVQFKAKTGTTNNAIVPELGGTSNFPGNTSGMLVVIDGFPQDNFSADYPMNNVASVEVIRDPAECLKWGPRGVNGVILITTNLPKPGELEINYNSNFYFSPPPDISAGKLRLASSADLLDYYKEAYNKRIVSYLGADSSINAVAPPNLSPAEILLFNLRSKKLTTKDFEYKWDSLASISNRDQLKMLHQGSFNQNHSIALSGGTRTYRFTAGGVYRLERSGIRIFNQRLGLNLKNDLFLFKEKLKINWTADITHNKNRSRDVGNGEDLDPYQLLLGPQGEYVYNYTDITPERNKAMGRLGYLEDGINLLQDFRANKNIGKSLQINSRLNFNWKISKSLNWSGSFNYGRSSSRNESLNGMESSQIRQLINRNGSLVRNDRDNPNKVTGIDFYIPMGGRLNTTTDKNYNYNIRSGFNFNHTFGSDHHISATLDGTLASTESGQVPGIALYGYDEGNGTSLPIPASDGLNPVNYFGSSINLDQLFNAGLARSTYNRSLALNGNMSYSYLNRYSLNARYAANLIPSFGEEPPYSATINRSASASWQINRENFFKVNCISNLRLTATASEMQVANLPLAQVRASRYPQTLWDNNAIMVSSYNTAEQSGQKNQNLGLDLEAGLFEDHLQLQLGYTSNNNVKGNNTQWNGRLAYDIAREPYFRFPFMSSLKVDLSLQNISSYQGVSIMMDANSLSSGGFGMSVTDNYGQLPPQILNKEARLMMGVDKDRFILDLRYYHKTTSGLSNGNQPTDPATGLGARTNYSKMANKGIEISLRSRIIRDGAFGWTVTMNGAYNINKAIDVPLVNFSFTPGYLSANRNGYSADALWNFRWAGLDNLGNPQVYNAEMKKVSVGDPMFTTNAFDLVYVGRTTPPWTGAVIQEWQYKGFFASARLLFNLGHVMRRYMPALSSEKDKSIEISNRWRKPGDEAFTDVAAIAPLNSTRRLIIQGSDNAVLPADHIRLREVQLGYEVPQDILKTKFIKRLSISAQVQNVALWTRNKMHLDPATISNIGVVGITPPRTYVMSVNLSY